jgi:hypothetical protein
LFFTIAGKSKIAHYSIGSTAAALLLTLITYLIFGMSPGGMGFYVLLLEVYQVTIVIFVRALRKRIEMWVYKDDFTQQMFLDDFFSSLHFFQYAFTFLLFAMLGYVYVRNVPGIYLPGDKLFFVYLPVSLALANILYEIIKIKRYSRRLNAENWLPIVNEKGNVLGKIERSESMRMKNTFMHPGVRIALLLKDKLYLQPRTEDDWTEINRLDHPLKRFLFFGEDIEEAARKMANTLLQKADTGKLQFLLKYTFKNENTHRLIFLYALQIDSEEQLKPEAAAGGKFWSRKHIEESIEILCEYFQLEYEYLKNTLLLHQT